MTGRDEDSEKIVASQWFELSRDERAQLGRLRVEAWRAIGVSLANDNDTEFVDEFDAGALHFRMFDSARLIAAGRVTMHAFASKLPDGLDWADAASASRVAVIGRLVVHPVARRLGCAKSIDEARLKAISNWAPDAAVLAISSTRERALRALGFLVVRRTIAPSTKRAAAVLVRLPDSGRHERSS